MGISGWYINITTEKNKLAPSQESVLCVFDKRTGLHKFWSEYTFLSEMTRTEIKYFKDEKHLKCRLAIRKSGPQVFLEMVDPTTGEKQYASDKFYRKDALKVYESDENFKAAFDYITQVSVEYRINKGLFQLSVDDKNQDIDSSDVDVETLIDTHEVDSPDIDDPHGVESPDVDDPHGVESPNVEDLGTYQSAFD
jgi:hypothetical protein